MDWSVLESANTLIDGISQNAWDTGAGTGIYFMFATYMKKEQKVVSYALITPVLNNLISLMMGKSCLKYNKNRRHNVQNPSF
jgi:NSS family neurotransmitter:Na+ symporter